MKALIGRSLELEVFKDYVKVGPQDAQKGISILNTFGCEGIGKTSCLSYCSNLLRDEKTDAFVFELSFLPEVNTLSSLLNTLKSSVYSQRDEDRRFLIRFLDSILQILESEQNLNIQTIFQSSDLLSIYMEESELLKLSSLKKNFYIFIDDYDQLASKTKSLISEISFLFLNSFPELKFKFILSSYQSLDSGIDLDIYWGQEINYKTLEILPFGKKDVVQFLNLSGIKNTVDVNEVIRLTKGIPLFLERYVESLKSLDSTSNNTKISRFLENKSSDQMRILCATAHLKNFELEGLSVLWGREPEKELLDWLGGQVELFYESEQSGLLLKPQYKEFLLKYQSEVSREDFVQFSEKSKLFNKIKALIPIEEDRKLLRYFLFFKSFNKALIGKIFPFNSNSLQKFLSLSPQYFLSLDSGNFKLKEYLSEFVEKYKDWFPVEGEHLIGNEILKEWAAEKTRISGEIDQCAKRLSTLKKKRSDELKQIEVLEDAYSSFCPDSRDVSISVKKKSSSLSFKYVVAPVLILFGVFLLYFGIIFSEQHSLAVGGGIFIVFGYVWVARKEISSKVLPEIINKKKTPMNTSQMKMASNRLNLTLNEERSTYYQIKTIESEIKIMKLKKEDPYC